MSFARHNGGAFAHRHPDNSPVIESYADAYSFLIARPQEFRIEDAVAVRIFDLRLQSNLVRKERLENRRLSETEVDEYIRNTYGVEFLAECQEKASEAILTYRVKQPFFRTSAYGAWQGFLGNVLTAIIAALLVLGGYIMHEQNLGVSTVAFYERCIAPAFK